jgi:hypothetical protein
VVVLDRSSSMALVSGTERAGLPQRLRAASTVAQSLAAHERTCVSFRRTARRLHAMRRHILHRRQTPTMVQGRCRSMVVVSTVQVGVPSKIGALGRFGPTSFSKCKTGGQARSSRASAISPSFTSAVQLAIPLLRPPSAHYLSFSCFEAADKHRLVASFIIIVRSFQPFASSTKQALVLFPHHLSNLPYSNHRRFCDRRPESAAAVLYIR